MTTGKGILAGQGALWMLEGTGEREIDDGSRSWQEGKLTTDQDSGRNVKSVLDWCLQIEQRPLTAVKSQQPVKSAGHCAMLILERTILSSKSSEVKRSHPHKPTQARNFRGTARYLTCKLCLGSASCIPLLDADFESTLRRQFHAAYQQHASPLI